MHHPNAITIHAVKSFHFSMFRRNNVNCREFIPSLKPPIKILNTFTAVKPSVYLPLTYQELMELYKDLDTVADIKKKTLDCFGHVVRLDQGRRVTKIFEIKPEGMEEGEGLD